MHVVSRFILDLSLIWTLSTRACYYSSQIVRSVQAANTVLCSITKVYVDEV